MVRRTIAGSVFPRDLAGAVLRAGIDEHDFIGPTHAGQGAADIGLFIHRHDGHRNGHSDLLIAAQVNQLFNPQSSTNPSRINNASRGATANFAQQKRRQNKQLRFDGMAVAGVRIDEVINRGVGRDQSGEKPSPGAFLP